MFPPFALLAATVLALAVAACAEPAAATPPRTDLEQALSAEEFAATGLHKLTPEELQRLDAVLKQRRLFQAESFAPRAAESSPSTAPRRWLPWPARKEAPAAAAAEPADTKVREMGEEQLPRRLDRTEQPTELRTRIAGYFSGLSGSSVFVLENGQVWQQRFNETYYQGRPIKDPAVTLVRVWNGYRLVIDELKLGFAVKRLE